MENCFFLSKQILKHFFFLDISSRNFRWLCKFLNANFLLKSLKWYYLVRNNYCYKSSVLAIASLNTTIQCKYVTYIGVVLCIFTEYSF